MNVNCTVMDGWMRDPENYLMVDSDATFAARFARLRGSTSFESLSEAIYRRYGKRISAPAMHKWAQGGGITVDNLRILADHFGVSPAWLMLGEGSMHGPVSLEHVLHALPDNNGPQVLDFIRYKIERAEGMIASDRLGEYMKMIDTIRQDMERRRKEDEAPQ